MRKIIIGAFLTIFTAQIGNSSENLDPFTQENQQLSTLQSFLSQELTLDFNISTGTAVGVSTIAIGIGALFKPKWLPFFKNIPEELSGLLLTTGIGCILMTPEASSILKTLSLIGVVGLSSGGFIATVPQEYGDHRKHPYTAYGYRFIQGIFTCTMLPLIYLFPPKYA